MELADQLRRAKVALEKPDEATLAMWDAYYTSMGYPPGTAYNLFGDNSNTMLALPDGDGDANRKHPEEEEVEHPPRHPSDV